MKHRWIAATLLATKRDSPRRLRTRRRAKPNCCANPALSDNALAFVYAGDIWIAAPDGSNPVRLTSHPADERDPVFSPDGTKIAYTANYDGNADVFVIDVRGGEPQRLTWHPGDDTAIDWAPDGTAVAMVSARERRAGRSAQLYHVGLDGGLPRKISEAEVFSGSYDESGRVFANVPYGSANAVLTGGGQWLARLSRRAGPVAPADRFLRPAPRPTFPVIAPANSIRCGWAASSISCPIAGTRGPTSSAMIRPPAKSRRSPAKAIGTSAKSPPTTDVSSTRRAACSMRSTWRAAPPAACPIHAGRGPARTPARVEAGRRPDDQRGAIPLGARGFCRDRAPAKCSPCRPTRVPPANISQSAAVRDYTAIWSDDGSRLAYVTDDGSAQVLVIEDQSGIEPVRRIPVEREVPRIDRLGQRRTAYRLFHQQSHPARARRGKRDGLAKSRKARGETAISEATMSPTGRWVAYTIRGANENAALNLYDLAKSPQSRGDQRFCRYRFAAILEGRQANFVHSTPRSNAGSDYSGLRHDDAGAPLTRWDLRRRA